MTRPVAMPARMQAILAVTFPLFALVVFLGQLHG